MACGGRSFANGGESEGGSGGSTEAGTASGGPESGGRSSGGTSSGGGNHAGSSSGGKASGGAADQCDSSQLQNETSDGVEVRLINGTQHAIYLGNVMPGCDVPLVQVQSATGQPVPDTGSCGNNCQELLSGNIGCAPILCPVSSVLTLAPGESTVTTWSALYSETVSVPPVCQSKSIGVTCQRLVRAKPGTYVFSSQAGSSMQCSAPDLMSCQTCEPSGDGGCRTFAAFITGPILQAEAKVELDASYGIGTEPAARTRQVEITFRD
jgi:hypothetical protein